MKRRLALVLASAMLLTSAVAGLASCKSGGNNGNADASKGHVYYLQFKPEQDQQWQDLAKLYTEKTGVQVDVLTAAEGTYETTLASEIAKTDAPTLFQVNGPVGQVFHIYVDAAVQKAVPGHLHVFEVPVVPGKHHFVQRENRLLRRDASRRGMRRLASRLRMRGRRRGGGAVLRLGYGGPVVLHAHDGHQDPCDDENGGRAGDHLSDRGHTRRRHRPAVGVLLGVPAPLADIAPPSVPLLIGELLPGAFPHGAAGGDRCDQDDGENDEQAV